jgi:putative NADPH-quinone reductase
MGKRVLVINGHPDRSEGHLCAAFAAAYECGAATAGHEVRKISLAQVEFPMLRSQAEFESGKIPPELQSAVSDIQWAEHLVLIFPLWLGTMPAMLKAFLEQVMRPGVAFEYAANGGLPKSLLKGRSARLIVTMGMPQCVFRFWYLDHGLATLRRSILNFVGISPVREMRFGMVDQASDATRRGWIAKVQALGARAI